MIYVVNCSECAEEIRIDLNKCKGVSFEMECPRCEKKLYIEVQIFVTAEDL